MFGPTDRKHVERLAAAGGGRVRTGWLRNAEFRQSGAQYSAGYPGDRVRAESITSKLDSADSDRRNGAICSSRNNDGIGTIKVEFLEAAAG